jgi:hypothetical protein
MPKLNRMVTVVSGLPRSGTSLVMQMLEAGGMPVFTDNKRKPDIDNPLGYFEAEAVTNLANDSAWLELALGRAVKITSPLLPSLPASYDYKIIFVFRRLEEVLLSQREMLLHRNQPAPDDDARMAQIFSEHLESSFHWLEQQPNMELMVLPHRECICQPAQAASAIGQFLGNELDIVRMAAVVRPELYRRKYRPATAHTSRTDRDRAPITTNRP